MTIHSPEYDNVKGITTIRESVIKFNSLDFSHHSWKKIFGVLETVKTEVSGVMYLGKGKKILLRNPYYGVTGLKTNQITKERFGVIDDLGKLRVIGELDDIEAGKPAMIDGGFTIEGEGEYTGVVKLPRKELQDKMRMLYAKVILWHIEKDRELNSDL